MNIWKRSLAILLVFLLAALTGCTAKDGPGDAGTSGIQTDAESVLTEPETAPAAESETEQASETVPIIIEIPSTDWGTVPESARALTGIELENCFDWIGRTAKQAKIPDDTVEKGGELWEICLEGSLFGGNASGTAYINDRGDGMKVDRVILQSGDLSYEDCLEQLNSRFGEPGSEGEEPSAQSGKGAVTWAVFENKNSEIWLSKGSQEEFVKIEIY